LTSIDEFDMSWFYFDSNQTEIPVNIQVTSPDNISAWLIGMKTLTN
jgi:hypothetical protein